MSIRTFQPGDDAAQVTIYNEAAADLPKFKPASLDEVRRRCAAPDFDPATRLYAIDGGRPVGYATFAASGRIGFPWCRRGFEQHAEPLFDALLAAMRQRGIVRGWAAYRADWTGVADFFVRHGFAAGRQMLNYFLDLEELPTPSARGSSLVCGAVTPADLPALLALVPGLSRAHTAAELEQALLHNPYFPADSVYALRERSSGQVLAAAILVHNPAYAAPKALDANMPCFRLGAWGTEGLTHKRIDGMLSVLMADNRDANRLGLDLLATAAQRLDETEVGTLAAQVPGDQAHLVRFYRQYFRAQGSFPLYERDL
jgi:hypothetical protein